MISLTLLIALSVALGGLILVVWRYNRRGISAHFKAFLNIGLTVLYVSLIVIAARFGARTFPGIWVPNHPVLNNFMQGGMFYMAAGLAIICGAIDLILNVRKLLAMQAGADFANAVVTSPMRWIKWGLLMISVSITSYGLLIAYQLQRLP